MKLPPATQMFSMALPHPLGRVECGGILIKGKGAGFARMRRLGHYQLVLILNGEGIYRDIEGREFPLKKGDLFVTTPDVPHQYGPVDGNEWDELFMGFRGKIFEAWHQAGILRPQERPIPLKPLGRWYTKFRQILTLRDTEWREPLRHLVRFQSLLGEIPFEKPVELKDQLGWVQTALEMLEGHDSAKPRSMAEVAAACGLGVHTFRREFARLTGRGPIEYQNHMRMETACRILITTKIPIKGIAQQLGFCDPFHFSVAFKNYAHVSPRQFRQENAKRFAIRFLKG